MQKKLETKISGIAIKSQQEIEKALNSEDIEKLRIKYLGRKGIIRTLFQSLTELDIEEKKEFGQAINKLRDQITAAIDDKAKNLLEQSFAGLGKEKIDLTYPGYPAGYSHEHPLMRVMNEVVDIFVSLGFQIALGPEMETNYFNFDALNFQIDHPARDMQDTFYLKPPAGGNNGQLLLRTHTSPVQIHVMEKFKPPVRVVIPGRCYRNDAIDATHSPTFHQIEGLSIDENVTFSDLKGTLAVAAKRFFGEDITVRFRPSFFPFTEPSAEMDVKCVMCKGAGCRVCKNTGWLETLGCGMVHPNVLKNVNYDTEKYTGFAFGLGVERFAMLKFGIDDMRMFYENDLRFLKQF